MSSKDSESSAVVAIKQKIEDYYSTIHALQAFVSMTTWDNGKMKDAFHSLGRRMHTSLNNRISSDNRITPDAVIQRTPTLGYVVEAKKNLPSNTRQEWDKVIEQLLKYDDDLTGWWTDTGYIDNHCVVLLLEISRGVEFTDYLKQYLQSNQISFARKTSVVEFNRADEFRSYFMLRTRWGDIDDNVIQDALRKGLKIVREDVVGTYGEKKFYDVEPETEFTMVVLWQDIFTDFAQSAEFDKALKAYIIEVDVNALTKELQRLYGSQGNAAGEVQFPRKAWIKKACNGFVRVGVADVIDKDRYRIYFKALRGDLITRFAKQRKKTRANKESDGTQQLSYLGDE